MNEKRKVFRIEITTTARGFHSEVNNSIPFHYVKGYVSEMIADFLKDEIKTKKGRVEMTKDFHNDILKHLKFK